MSEAVLAILLTCPLFAQAPEFQVASIKPFDLSAQGQVLAIAYKIKATLISGPDRTASERFDISATLPAGSTTAELPEMFQALLGDDRFQVKLQKDKKELPIYALLVAKGGSK